MEKIATVIGFTISGLIGLWSLWLTWCAFFGGSVWVIFGWWQFEGVDIIRGLLFLFIGEPIIFTIAYWVGLLITMPILLVINLFNKNSNKSI